ncbi:hypothetical protein T05_3001 [Trichinella murrelli]|uniref:Uncharacterized protein n=1 Tax=Trichinella murrelli TaxID=144512 RepID=A0A0V0TJ06_9BILA|nr:hypothetical protein T05_3001 [Trichinella murrelli]
MECRLLAVRQWTTLGGFQVRRCACPLAVVGSASFVGAVASEVGQSTAIETAVSSRGGSCGRRLLFLQLQGNIPQLTYQVFHELGGFGFLRLWITGARLPPLVEIFFRPHDFTDQSLRASERVAGSCSRIARYASFEVIPPAKRATRSRSVTPALRPTSATSLAYCSMVWPSRWCRAWNRSISCPVHSSGPYASSNLFLNSSKEFSLVCPAG